MSHTLYTPDVDLNADHDLIKTFDCNTTKGHIAYTGWKMTLSYK